MKKSLNVKIFESKICFQLTRLCLQDPAIVEDNMNSIEYIKKKDRGEYLDYIQKKELYSHYKEGREQKKKMGLYFFNKRKTVNFITTLPC